MRSSVGFKKFKQSEQKLSLVLKLYLISFGIAIRITLNTQCVNIKIQMVVIRLQALYPSFTFVVKQCSFRSLEHFMLQSIKHLDDKVLCWLKSWCCKHKYMSRNFKYKMVSNVYIKIKLYTVFIDLTIIHNRNNSVSYTHLDVYKRQL